MGPRTDFPEIQFDALIEQTLDEINSMANMIDSVEEAEHYEFLEEFC
jgi:hypothetical protein